MPHNEDLFPRLNTHRYLIAIAGISGLPSGKRDVYAYISRFSQLGFTPYICIDSTSDLNWIRTHLTENKEPEPHVLPDLDAVAAQLALWAAEPTPVDVCLTISAHGYEGIGTSYFRFKGRMYGTPYLRKMYTPFESRGNLHRVITFIDTCHSGNMVGFQRKISISNHQPQFRSPIIAFAGCSQHQSLMEDMSDQYGYGGGLTSAVMDGIKDIKGGQTNLKTLASYCYGRIIRLGAHVSISQIPLNP